MHSQTLCVNGCQFKILLYHAFKLAQLTSFQSKNSFKLSTKKRGYSWANFNIHKRVLNWQPFMHRVYRLPIFCNSLHLLPTDKNVKTDILTIIIKNVCRMRLAGVIQLMFVRNLR